MIRQVGSSTVIIDMILKKENGLIYLQFPLLRKLPGFFHGIFMRRAWDEQGAEMKFNLGMGCGTDQTRVEKNRRRMIRAFGNGHTPVYARQVHGTQVGVWDARYPGTGSARIEADAMVTAQNAAALVIQTADCQSVIMIDPVRRVVANVHCGWRGSVGNIIGRTIDAMNRTYGSRPGDLLCGIGPSLGPCCAEFIHFRQEIPPAYWDYRRSADRFDFWRISSDQLAAKGVPVANINVAGICTKCNQHLFFSYRGDKRTGRFASVVGIGNIEGNPA